MTSLTALDHWIFDMDGTLTVAVHDFDRMRQALGIAPGVPILETLDAMPAEQARVQYERLDELEIEFARLATAQQGAHELLGYLRDTGIKFGILTRNSVALAHLTLECAGLAEFFPEALILGRESAAPKPAPDGINALLEIWNAPASHAVMIGDYAYDLEAGRRAGCATVYFDAHDTDEWTTQADLRVRSHHELRRLASR